MTVTSSSVAQILLCQYLNIAERLVRADKIFRTSGFIKFLNIWFASQLSKVWGISLMHSERQFKLAAWETERCFQVFPGGPSTEGKRKAGDELEVSEPSDSERSTNSVTEPRVYMCAICMRINVLFIESASLYLWVNEAPCWCLFEVCTCMWVRHISICLASGSGHKVASPSGDATATSACLPPFHSITQSDTRRQVN